MPVSATEAPHAALVIVVVEAAEEETEVVVTSGVRPQRLICVAQTDNWAERLTYRTM